MKEILEKVEKVVKEIEKNKDLLEKFDKEPVKVLESVLGMDLPDDQVEKIIDAVKAKIKIDDIGDALEGLGKLFKR